MTCVRSKRTLQQGKRFIVSSKFMHAISEDLASIGNKRDFSVIPGDPSIFLLWLIIVVGPDSMALMPEFGFVHGDFHVPGVFW